MDTPSCNILRFDGRSAVNLGDVASLGLVNQSFTAEAWIRLDAETNDDLSIFGMDVTTTGRGLHLVVRGMRPYMGFYNNDLKGRTTLVKGVWTHLAFSYNAQTQTQAITINGVLDAESGGHPPLAGAGTLWLGRWASGRFFRGDIAGARIWQGAVSGEALRARLFTAQPANIAGCLGSWPRAGEGEVISAAPPDGPPLGGSRAGVAVFAFRAPDSRIELRAERADITNALTAEAWVRPEGQAAELWRSPVISDHGPATGWELRCSARQAGFLVTVGGRHFEIAVPLVGDPHWLHLAGRYDGQEMSLFINGVLIESRSIGGPLTLYPEATSIGRNGVWLDRHYAGCIAEVRLWCRALANLEILAGAMSRQASGEGLFAHYALDRIGENNVVRDLAAPELLTVAINVSVESSDLPLGGSSTDEREAPAEDPAIQVLRDEVAAANRRSEALEQQLSNLMIHLSKSERYLSGLREDAATLQSDMAQLRAEKQQLHDTLMDQIEEAGAVPLERFVLQNQQALALAQSQIRASAGGYSLSEVELDVAYLPGPGGLGVVLPNADDAARLGPALSRMRLHFAQELHTQHIEEPPAEVPNLQGISELEAGTRLARLGLEISVHDQAVTDANDDFFVGRVALQHPVPGTMLAPGSIVNVFVGVKA